MNCERCNKARDLFNLPTELRYHTSDGFVVLVCRECFVELTAHEPEDTHPAYTSLERAEAEQAAQKTVCIQTLRDRFATACLPALIERFGAVNLKLLAGKAYEVADAMLAARAPK